MTDAEPVTELNLLVGSIFTTQPDEDHARFEEEKEAVAELQDLLREEGIEVDLLSRPGVEVWEGGIERFSDLYHLLLLAAYLEQGRDVTQLRNTKNALTDEPDPLLVSIWEGKQPTRFPHLINHQAEGGYYLPVDFPEPIWLKSDQEEQDPEDQDENTMICFGSSIALQRELGELATMFQKAGVPESSKPGRCLSVLSTAASQSVTTDLPIIIW